MISLYWRFCLYGLFKNQRAFEPFLVLALFEKGLSFFEFGLLLAFRELIINLVEIPSGAIADRLGRRGALMLCFVAYFVSMLLFAWGPSLGFIVAAMAFYGIGDAFRSGSHKAMIFTWLKREDRLSERAEVYGTTRSWSKMGSAISVLLAAAIVLSGAGYKWLFLSSAGFCVLSLLNLLGYPADIDRPAGQDGQASVAELWTHTKEALSESWTKPQLRSLLLESMAFEGLFLSCKDYLQPVLQALALSLLSQETFGANSDKLRTTLILCPVYFVLFLASAGASRQAKRLVKGPKGEKPSAAQQTARLQRARLGLWWVYAGAFAAILGGAWFRAFSLVVLAYLVIHIIQNVWRPLLVSRFDELCQESQQATILSIESQSRRVAAMIFAPILGYALERSKHASNGSLELWPVGALGLSLALIWALRHSLGKVQPAASS